MAVPGLAGDMPAREVARLLGLAPHPEGGRFKETWRSPAPEPRGAMSVIHYLLEGGEVSAWHKVDADEAWFWHAGGPLALSLSPPDGKGASAVRLGPALRMGERPHAVVPKDHWQAAESLGAWTLVSCAVAPGFDFSGFEMAPEGWRPEMPDASAGTGTPR